MEVKDTREDAVFVFCSMWMCFHFHSTLVGARHGRLDRYYYE